MEDVLPFQVQQITLSGRDQFANPLKANVYTLEGVTNADGSLRLMSISQLCMAICLRRASSVEETLIGLMNDMAANSASLKDLSDVEQKFADLYNRWDASSASKTTFESTFAGDLATRFNNLMTSYYKETYGDGHTPSYSVDTSAGKISVSSDNIDQFFSDVEAAMDTLNTTSQELLIDIESYTAKRDDTYALVSNLSKVFYQSCSAVANNLP